MDGIGNDEEGRYKMYNVEDQFMGKPGLYDGDRGGKRKKGP
jgi:hypothetical protein